VRARAICRAVDWLVKSQFVPEISLCREAPKSAPPPVWLLSDNLLAFNALRPYRPDIAGQIRSRLQELGHTRNGKHSCLFELEDIPPHATRITDVRAEEGYAIRTETMVEGQFHDYRRYVDVTVYQAVQLLRRGRRLDALRELAHLEDGWDGDSFHRQRDPYKLALYLIAFNQTGLPYSKLQFMVLKRLLDMRRVDGSFATGYIEDPKEGEGNTETTSLAVMALDGRRLP